MSVYWVASVVVGDMDFEKLNKLGFVTLSPMVKEYVFLEVNEKNKRFLRKQSVLGIRFLKDQKGEFSLVQEKEFDSFKGNVYGRQELGIEIRVVSGYCVGLEGRIESREGDLVRCKLGGWRREYDVVLHKSEVVALGDDFISPELGCIEDMCGHESGEV